MTEGIYQKRWWLFGLLAILYLAGFNGQWRIGRDTALYRQLGHNLALGKGYIYHGEPHTHAYPGLPLLLAGCELLFGQSPIPPLLLMLAMAAACLALIYRTLLLGHPPWIAVMVTVLTGISGTFFEFTSEILTDIPFLLGVWVCLYGLERLRFTGTEWQNQISYLKSPEIDDHAQGKPNAKEWTVGASCLILGLLWCAAFRPTFWIIVAALILTGVWQMIRKPRWIYLGLLLAPILVGLLWLSLDPRTQGINPTGGEYERGFWTNLPRRMNLENLGSQLIKNIPKVFEDELPQAFFGVEVAPVFNSILVIIMLIGTVWMTRRRPVWGLIVLGIVLYTIFFSPPRNRYYLMAIPLMITGWVLFLTDVTRRIPRPHGNRVLVWWMTGLLISNLIACGDHTIKQRSAPFLEHYQHGRWIPVIQISDAIREHVGVTEKVIGPEARVMTFLSDRKVVDGRSFLRKGDRRRWAVTLKDTGISYVVLPSDSYVTGSNMRLLMEGGVIVPTEIIAKEKRFGLARFETRLVNKWWRKPSHLLDSTGLMTTQESDAAK